MEFGRELPFPHFLLSLFHTQIQPLVHLFLVSNRVSHYNLSPHTCHSGQSPVMMPQGNGALVCVCVCVCESTFHPYWVLRVPRCLL